VLTIVMYHYVRDVESTPYPGIKARSLAEFRGQLDHIEREYEVVGCEAVRGRCLPANAALLTFDDGLVDHLEHVLPELRRRPRQRDDVVPQGGDLQVDLPVASRDDADRHGEGEEGQG
jgi:hypothetical protein